jgi:hypothetical protein
LARGDSRSQEEANRWAKNKLSNWVAAALALPLARGPGEPAGDVAPLSRDEGRLGVVWCPVAGSTEEVPCWPAVTAGSLAADGDAVPLSQAASPMRIELTVRTVLRRIIALLSVGDQLRWA